MLFRRIVNIVVSVLLIGGALAVMCYFVSHLYDQSELLGRTNQKNIPSGTDVFWATLLLVVYAFLSYFFFAVAVEFFTIVFENGGILWRKVNPNDYLIDKEGSRVYVFEEEDLIWTFNPIFSKTEFRRSTS